MKIQNMAVIFCVIIIPIVLVLSSYLQSQISTITLQTQYDSYLLDATYDAVAAFQINISNEDLSTVSDSLRSIIDASTNTFVSSLAMSLGISNANENMVKPYIPAILYTLYDGYYIYTPTRVTDILTNDEGELIRVGDVGVKKVATDTDASGLTYGVYSYDGTTAATFETSDYGRILHRVNNGATNKSDYRYTTSMYDSSNPYPTYYKTDFMLKPFSAYTARYVVGNDIDITINYTLDNFISLYGSIKGVYYSKSGYLINPDSVTINQLLDASGNDITNDVMNRDERRIKEAIIGDEIKYGKITLADGSVIEFDKNSGTTYNKEATEAVSYYLSSKYFSNWLKQNLSIIEERNIIQDAEEAATIAKNDRDGKLKLDGVQKIFNLGNTNNPEDLSSDFAQHRMKVIRNNIQYNLNLTISAYSEMSQGTGTLYNFKLPILLEEDWEKITTSVTMVSFFQGMKCGTKFYNNYAIVVSQNNEQVINEENIFFSKEGEFNLPDGSGEYHRIDCPHLLKNADGTEYTGMYLGYRSVDWNFDKGVYDEVNNENIYSFKNAGCYYCIVGNSYTPENIDEVDTDAKKKRLTSYNVAIDKEKNKLYKSIALTENYGYTIDENAKGTFTGSQSFRIANSDARNKELKTVRSISIVISNTTFTNTLSSIKDFTISLGGKQSQGLKIYSNHRGEQTITWDNIFIDSTATLGSADITLTTDAGITYTIESVLVKYNLY